MRRFWVSLYFIVMSPTLMACTSLRGMPEPVIDVDTATTIPPDYELPKVIETINNKSGDEEKRRYRNKVMAFYIAAADARYHQFRKNLSRDKKGTLLGLDLGSMALNTLGSVIESAASELSAGAGLLTGARSSISKELYFEKTLPALIAAVDTNRLRKRTALVSHLKDSIADYPMELAFADLSEYELSASLDGGIQQLTSDANRSQSKEFKVYEDAIESCSPTSEVGSYWRVFRTTMYGLAGSSGGRQKLLRVAEIVGLENESAPGDKENAEDLAGKISVQVVQKYCNVRAMQALNYEIEKKASVNIPMPSDK